MFPDREKQCITSNAKPIENIRLLTGDQFKLLLYCWKKEIT